MNTLLQPLDELFDNKKLKVALKNTPHTISFTGCTASSRAQLYGNFEDDFPRKIILCFDEIKAKEFIEEARTFNTRPMYFPETDLLFAGSNVKNNIIEENRMAVIKEILTADEFTVVTTGNALLSKMPPINQFNNNVINLTVGKEYNLENIAANLINIGYERASVVESSGVFALRGCILDIFPLSADNPVRIEFFGDEIESIRYFSTKSQRSIEETDNISIYPIKTNEETDLQNISIKDYVSFIDYFKSYGTLVVLNDANQLFDNMEETFKELSDSIDKRVEAGESVGYLSDRVFEVKDIISKLEKYSVLSLSVMDSKIKGFKNTENISLKPSSILSYEKSLESLVNDLNKFKKNKERVVLTSSSTIRAKRLKENLESLGVTTLYSEEPERTVKPGEVVITISTLAHGFSYPNLKWTLITEGDIFGQASHKKIKRKKYAGEKIAHFNDLHPGDFVVHETYGIGLYKGIEKIERDGVASDYMAIEYAGSDKLYVPVTDFNVIQKYAAADAKAPRLSKLGGQTWNKTKARVKKAVEEVARDLVILYASREETKGFVYDEDTVWQREFEDSFPYEETVDQLNAIDDVKRDMESPKIMDRLICGDVGYGKTEVALRAAFKAVQENKQVAYLVPTTILAKQHYDTFIERLKDFPVSVELLCRFKTSTEQKKTIDKLKNGAVDIVIGTHRLLSQDVSYKDLGLLIIDEEQRFGVTHKEKIKKLKRNVDVLTLSATPIPRTLHMSLVGIRSMSVLEEPPKDRMAIQTYVMEYEDETIREAVNRELRRGGQVYYVFNKVKGIAEMARKIALLCPGARVDFVHGQMNEKELEDKMYDFINGDIDVLVSTTIIETGLDIPNVNTMLIHDADHMGLSQLYQLRGRVGRSNRSAYCFLLVRKGKSLSEDASKRLEAIREFTALGSGFKIAMKDLEIRGAGNLLGASQSGHMASVGYDLYCKMLGLAVKELKGEVKEEDYFETTIDLKVDAYIPDTYIYDEVTRLDIYKDISSITSAPERAEMEAILEDRFGKVPSVVKRLMDVALLKALAHDKGILEITERPREIRFIFYEKAKIDPNSIVKLVKLKKNRMKLIPGQRPELIHSKDMLTYTKNSSIEIVNKVLNNLVIID